MLFLVKFLKYPTCGSINGLSREIGNRSETEFIDTNWFPSSENRSSQKLKHIFLLVNLHFLLVETYFPTVESWIVVVRPSSISPLMKPSLLLKEPVSHKWRPIFSILDPYVVVYNNYRLPTSVNVGDFNEEISTISTAWNMDYILF